MKKKLRAPVTFLISLLFLSGCRLGQLLIPTATPTITNTLIPTATNTLTPNPTPMGGGLIAFVSPREFNICFIHVNGSNRSCLDVKGIEPAWSPDGRQLVFHSPRDEHSGLYVMNADGTNIVRLTYNSPIELDRNPAWSPDGKYIAFSSIDDDIYIMNTDGTNIVRFADGICSSPVWSPDGKYIAFASGKDPSSDTSTCHLTGMYLKAIDGSDPTLLLPGSARPEAWSPDGKRLAFISKRDAPPVEYWPYVDIYFINIDGTNLTRLTYDGTGGTDLTWSPDGLRIVFEKYDYEKHLPLIYIIDADGSDMRVVTEGIDGAWQPYKP